MKQLYNGLSDGFIAGYTTGADGHFRYFNLCDIGNYRSVAETFHLTCDHMVRVHQGHTDRIRIVGSENGGEGILRAGTDAVYDAMISADANLILCMISADCVPVFLYDDETGTIALVHSGRAGTMAEIAAKTVKKMRTHFGTKPENLRAILGPCLCAEHHEVREKDVSGFYHRFSDEECGLFLKKINSSYYVDMHTAIKISLLRLGILPEHITADPACTYEDPALPSWRRTHDPDAHMLSFLVRLNFEQA